MPRRLMIPMTLQSLPIEIICQIFVNLDMLDLLACSMYTIELGKHKMVSTLPPSVGPSFSTRLKLLRERERAWKYLDFKKKDTLQLPPTGSVYEFVGGLYGNGREDESRVTASISFLELPSTDDPSQDLQIWTHSMGEIIIVDFTMDPSQDLLVLVALAPADSRYIYELHLRSIKTNQPHPKAPIPILSCLRKPTVHLQSSEVVAAVRVQVAGHLLALLIKEAVEGTTAHLEIWNWESSPQFSCAMGRADGIDDFTFLDDHSFLVVLPPGQFEVYTFTDPTKSSNAPVLRITYAFPPLSDGYLYWYISMSSNPAPGYVPRCATDQNDVPGKSRQLYYPRSDERIHACCLYIYNPSSEENHHVHSFVFFLNLKSLLNPPAEWFSGSQLPRYKHAHRRHRANGSRSSPTGSPSPSDSSATIPSKAPLPGFQRSNSLSSNINGTSSSTSQHLPLYPPFPTFDSLPTNPNGRASSGEISDGPDHSSGSRHRRTIPDKVQTVPWDVWGPQSTRWFEECLSTDWQHAVYGLRTVESLDPAKHAKLPSPFDEIIEQHLHQAASEPSQTPSYASVGIQTGSPTNGVIASPSSDVVNDGPPQLNGVASSSFTDSSSSHHASVGNQADRSRRRYLRLRDFNPYSFERAVDLSDKRNVKGKGKSERTTLWRRPRLVVEPSTTDVKGVFKNDIVSSLPYMEIISEEAFEVTDVMMDDCRLLLLKRGESGKLKQVDVLMM
ncbi:hypothetical protein CPB84DRAFT_1817387 [Gymnopilus junonius]|uniref:F-box domain-containing protein n=1 Tax=Gymnopilus junonius TaxID=109634 RepID=A0A9P5NDD0_GYMJU|nr:hypothetical protein CPB84DRAFT_1817387 [Gymnopilus junonius]